MMDIDSSGNFFDTQRHTKIWFSSSPDVFLNTENELRLVRFLNDNPSPSELSLVYSSKLLGEKGLADLRLFRKKYPSVLLVDFDTDLKDRCETENDRKIYELAREELLYSRDLPIEERDDLDPSCYGGGNLAAASDLARLLTPLVHLGTYSDFDTEIKTKGLDRYIPIQEGYIANIDAFQGIPIINNDIQSYARNSSGELSADALQFLSVMQETVIQAYTNIPETLQSHSATALSSVMFAGSVLQSHPDLKVFQIRNMIDHMDSLYMFFKMSFPLLILSTPAGALNAFVSSVPGLPIDTVEKIKRDFANMPGEDTLEKLRQDFSDLQIIDFPPDHYDEIELAGIRNLVIAITILGTPQIQAQLANFEMALSVAEEQYKPGIQRQILNFRATMGRLMTVAQHYTSGEEETALKLLLSPTVTPNMIEEITQEFLLKKDSVVLFSGPLCTASALARIKGAATSMPEWYSIASLSLRENPILADAYRSTNGVTAITGGIKQKPASEIGEICDAAWTRLGKAKQEAREILYRKSAQKIQSFVDRHRTCSTNPTEKNQATLRKPSSTL